MSIAIGSHREVSARQARKVSGSVKAGRDVIIDPVVIARSDSDEAIHTFFAALWIASLRSQ
jgi:hypothetical protein